MIMTPSPSLSMTSYFIISLLFSMVFISASLSIENNQKSDFQIKDANVKDIQTAFKLKKLTSRQLVKFYIGEIKRLNLVLKSVLELNPDALSQADKADQERKANASMSFSGMHGIPILLQDNIGTKDKLNTTAGSFALLGSVVHRDAGVVKKLRKAGAIILGKSSMSEWASFRSGSTPNGWSARGGLPVNPYVAGAACAAGSAISVAASMVTVSLGTETNGNILCPSNYNSIVGFKPTVGLTSRAGVIPITPREDTVGPMCRTVSDAVYVLDVIVGHDYNDDNATKSASKYIPRGGYLQFLKTDGLKGKRIGITFYDGFGFFFPWDLDQFSFDFDILRDNGATVLFNLQVGRGDDVQSSVGTSFTLQKSEFKLALNAYLKGLVRSPVRYLADVIAFNSKHSKVEKIVEYGQGTFLDAEKTNGTGKYEIAALQALADFNTYGYEALMNDNKLDALITPYSDVAGALSVGGYPGINVPAGYNNNGVPYGITFSGLKGSEPVLIEIAYAFEQATQARKPPPGVQ